MSTIMLAGAVFLVVASAAFLLFSKEEPQPSSKPDGNVLDSPSLDSSVKEESVVMDLSQQGPDYASLQERISDSDKFLFMEKRAAFLYRNTELSNEKYCVYDEKGKFLFIQRARGALNRIIVAFFAIAVGFGFFFALYAITYYVMNKHGLLNGGLQFLLSIAVSFILTYFVMRLFAPRRHIRFFKDESKSQIVLEVFQDDFFHFPESRYTLKKPDGQVLARFVNNHLSSALCTQWDCCSPGGQLLFRAVENSFNWPLLLRILTRPLFLLFSRMNYIVTFGNIDDVAGELKYFTLDVSKDESRRLDRRLLVAIGVMIKTEAGW